MLYKFSLSFGLCKMNLGNEKKTAVLYSKACSSTTVPNFLEWKKSTKREKEVKMNKKKKSVQQSYISWRLWVRIEYKLWNKDKNIMFERSKKYVFHQLLGALWLSEIFWNFLDGCLLVVLIFHCPERTGKFSTQSPQYILAR